MDVNYRMIIRRNEPAITFYSIARIMTINSSAFFRESIVNKAKRMDCELKVFFVFKFSPLLLKICAIKSYFCIYITEKDCRNKQSNSNYKVN